VVRPWLCSISGKWKPDQRHPGCGLYNRNNHCSHFTGSHRSLRDEELILAISSFPAIYIGFRLSTKAVPILDKGFVRPAIFIFSAAAAIYVILAEIF